MKGRRGTQGGGIEADRVRVEGTRARDCRREATVWEIAYGGVFYFRILILESLVG